MIEIERQYRIEFSFKVDIFADSVDEAIKQARYHLMDDGIPADIVEAMDARATHASALVSFDPVNDDDEDICPVSLITGDHHSFISESGIEVPWSVMGDPRDSVTVCPSCAAHTGLSFWSE
jgi:hypothetical protein